MSDLSAPRPGVAVRFTLDADVAPGLLPRLLQPFAKRDLTPDLLSSSRDGDRMRVEIAMATMPPEIVHLVAGNFRQVVGVRSVVELRSPLLSQVA